MNRELSGATVHVFPLITVKRGLHVGLQGDHQIRANHTGIDLAPSVYFCSENTIVMRTMEPCPVADWTWRKAEARARHIWARNESEFLPGQLQFNPNMLCEFLEDVRSPLLRRFPSRPYLQLTYGSLYEATHGDITAENTVLARDGTYRFIDWQPFRRSMLPPHRMVDYGKMLQSLIGWPGVQDRNIVQRDLYEFMALHPDAWIWCCVHYERIRLRAKSDADKNHCLDCINFCMGLHTKMVAVIQSTGE